MPASLHAQLELKILLICLDGVMAITLNHESGIRGHLGIVKAGLNRMAQQKNETSRSIRYLKLQIPHRQEAHTLLLSDSIRSLS